MDLLDGLKAFVATAQTGSFTAAAERMRISNRLTSKYVAELEQRVGARLFQRTTRKVGLTPTGEDLLARAPALLEELEDMLGAVSEESRGFSGLIRISAPINFGETYLGDMIRRFVAPHPDLSIDMRLSDAYVDLAQDGIDLAFRIGTSEVSSLKTRKLGEMSSTVVASPQYLADHAAPTHPSDLETHVCIVDTNRRAPLRWNFVSDATPISVVISRRYMVNSAQVARDWAIAGVGISYSPTFIVVDDIKAGRLVPLLDNFASPPHPISAVYLEGTVLPRKVRALIDFAIADMKKNAFASGLK